MATDNKKTKFTKGEKIFLALIILGIFIGITDKKDKKTTTRPSYEDNLRNGRVKEVTGEKMTDSEKRALNNFNKWKNEEDAKKKSKY